MQLLGVNSYNDFVKYVNTKEIISEISPDGEEIEVSQIQGINYLRNNDIFVSLEYLYIRFASAYPTSDRTQADFPDMVRRLYPRAVIQPCHNKDRYVKLRYHSNGCLIPAQ